jgi:rubrerythrin
MPIKSDEVKEIRRKLEEINSKLNHLLMVRNIGPDIRKFVPKTLFSLPKHLRKTAIAIVKLGQATAEQVATKTGRTRAAESDYLNQLVRQGVLKKEKIGREIRFSVYALYTLCQKCGAHVVLTVDNCPMCGAPISKDQQFEEL